MNFLKLLLGILSSVFSIIILIFLAISITIFLIFSNLQDAFSYEKDFINKRVSLGQFAINKYEITIKEFKEYAKKNNVITLAEKNGGGYEWGAGWEKRKGLNYKTLYGKPESDLEPATHINRFEAEKFANQ